MLFVKVPKAYAEKARITLRRAKLLDNNYNVRYNKGYVYFPVKDWSIALSIPGAEMVKLRARKRGSARSIYDELSKFMTSEEIKMLTKGYDLLGNIAIIEVPDALEKKERQIAEALISASKHIETVLKKAGPVHGIYRTRRLKYLAGRKNFIATYRENGCVFEFDVRKVFFSNRLSFERSRLCSIAKDGENIMVMFAGVGPFAIEIAKTHKNANIVAIELNKKAYEYMNRNIMLNKVPNVKAVLGDVRKVSMRFKGFADRIIMPMPKSSMLFLDEAYTVAKKLAFLHIYTFAPSKDSLPYVQEKIDAFAKKRKIRIRLLRYRIVRPYSAAEVELVLDLEMRKE
ncbi:MAG: class I SAM-dependent methyltransferase [Candidatus Micrarchaeia archaeon]